MQHTFSLLECTNNTQLAKVKLNQQGSKQIKKHQDKRLRKIVNPKGKSKKRYWKDFKVVLDISHLICQDIKKTKKAYHVNILSDRVFSCIHEHTIL